MIRNWIIGSNKIVLIVDHAGLEYSAENLIKSWLNAPKNLININSILPNGFKSTNSCDLTAFNDFQTDSNVLISISTLCQYYNPSTVFRLINLLKKTVNNQIFAWISVAHMSNPIICPFIEHMANAVVTLKSFSNAAILVKKSGGSVNRKFYDYQIDDKEFRFVEVQKETKQKIVEPEIDPESLASFKIGVEDEEMIARNALKLPYERTPQTTEPTESRIIYSPDSDDDFDDEDPDEDLYI